jgi:predicted HTH transcriptional regulator
LEPSAASDIVEPEVLMTLYYFDVKNGSTHRDHAGAEFESDDQAIDRAHIIADEMSQSKRPQPHCHISVIRADGGEVVQVTVASEAVPASAPRLKKSSQ